MKYIVEPKEKIADGMCHCSDCSQYYDPCPYQSQLNCGGQAGDYSPSNCYYASTDYWETAKSVYRAICFWN